MVIRRTKRYVSQLFCSRGVTVIECALTLPIFLFIIFSAIEFANLSFVQLALQYSLNQAARTESLQPSSREDLESSFYRYAQNFGIGFPTSEPNYIDIFSADSPECLSSTARCSNVLAEPVGSNQAMIVRVRHPSRLLFFPMTITLSATVTKQNEPYIQRNL